MKDKVIEGIVKEAGEKGLYIIYAQLRRGGKITEEFNRAKNKTRLNTFSISKSFVSAGIGIAMDEGLLTMDEGFVMLLRNMYRQTPPKTFLTQG